MKKIKFPQGFFWGAATSSHQVEGDTLNQWSVWEMENASRLASEAKTKWKNWQQEKFPEMFEKENYISGKACDHYNLFESDFELAKNLGHNAHRFSIEWSRIEPQEGEFDEKEIEHYRQVILALKKRGMEPFVTLWHWTNPLWLEKKGGCECPEFAKHFATYAEYVASKLGSDVKFWITLNEPTSVIASAYTSGAWPPAKKSYFAAWRLYGVFADAHNLAFDCIHRADKNAQVGFANILHSFAAYDESSLLDRLMVKIGRYIANKRMLNLTIGRNDFLTVQYYFHNRFKFPKKLRLKNKEESDLGWEIFPEGIYHILKRLKKYNLPVYVTENGLADAGDEKRISFIQNHLFWIHRAILEGTDVRGYFYWSLLDNFEWDKGFWPRFGLIEVDFATQERRIRPSALEYAKICKTNELEIKG
ncbi:MAG: glycoside hydrolase family 1 protein [bacterium]